MTSSFLFNNNKMFQGLNPGSIRHCALKSYCRRATEKNAPGDYPSGPSTSNMSRGLGLRRLSGQYISASLISWSWWKPSSPTMPISTTGWVTMCCACRWSRRKLEERRGEWYWLSGTIQRDGVSRWCSSMVQTWWSARSLPAEKGPHSLAHTSSYPPWRTYRTWRRSWHASGNSTPLC